MEMISMGFIAAVFTAGIVSFFSPCVLPLLPVYLGYLSGADAAVQNRAMAPLGKAVAFAAGISSSFFILGFGAGALGGLIENSYFFLACGVLVVLFGLHQSGLINITPLNREKKLNFKFNPQRGLAGAFALGFLFSFGWTPCVGPVLGAVLGFSAQQGGAVTGGGLLLVYSLGLSLPFIALALGSRHLLGRLKGVYPHFAKIRLVGGLLIMLMGSWMIWSQVENIRAKSILLEADAGVSSVSRPAYEVEMESLAGARASLADFKGKTVYVKFWATWCPLCLAGLDDFSALATHYRASPDIAVISVVTPGLNGEMSKDDFTAWATAQGVSFPIFFDEGGALVREFGVRAYPSAVYLDKHGALIKKNIGDESNEQVMSVLAGKAGDL